METIFPPPAWSELLRGRVQEAQLIQPDAGNGPPNKFCVPESVRSQVLQWSHSSKLTCHPDLNCSLDFIKQWFWWPTKGKDTCAFVSACSICARKKASHEAPAGLLQLLPIPHCTLSYMAVDFVTVLPPSEGNTVILTIVDRFSKAVHFGPLSKLPFASETADILVLHVFRIHGIPQDIVSDRGPVCITGLESLLSSSGHHCQLDIRISS